jgi:hypothetical protein
MKYRKFSVPILAILLAISFASCSNFSLDSLFTNYYKQAGLGQVTAAAIADAPVADLIDQSGIVAGQLSETFFEMLAANADAGGTLTQDTLDKLEVIMDDPVAQPAIAQAAIALAIEINLNEVGADQVIANAPAAFALFADPTFVITEPANLKKLLDLLLPASLLNRSIFTPAELETITAIVDKLNSLDLQNYFEKLVANLDLNGLQAQGMDAGTIAQIGLIVKVMNSITPLYPVGAPSLGASVAELLNHLEDNNLDPGLYIDYSNLMNNYQTILEDPALTTLLDAAGIDLQSIIDQFMNN